MEKPASNASAVQSSEEPAQSPVNRIPAGTGEEGSHKSDPELREQVASEEGSHTQEAAPASAQDASQDREAGASRLTGSASGNDGPPAVPAAANFDDYEFAHRNLPDEVDQANELCARGEDIAAKSQRAIAKAAAEIEQLEADVQKPGEKEPCARCCKPTRRAVPSSLESHLAARDHFLPFAGKPLCTSCHWVVDQLPAPDLYEQRLFKILGGRLNGDVCAFSGDALDAREQVAGWILANGLGPARAIEISRAEDSKLLEASHEVAKPNAAPAEEVPANPNAHEAKDTTAQAAAIEVEPLAELDATRKAAQENKTAEPVSVEGLSVEVGEAPSQRELVTVLSSLRWGHNSVGSAWHLWGPKVEASLVDGVWTQEAACQEEVTGTLVYGDRPIADSACLSCAAIIGWEEPEKLAQVDPELVQPAKKEKPAKKSRKPRKVKCEGSNCTETKEKEHHDPTTCPRFKKAEAVNG